MFSKSTESEEKEGTHVAFAVVQLRHGEAGEERHEERLAAGICPPVDRPPDVDTQPVSDR